MLIWLILVFLSSLELNREKGRLRFFEGFSVTRFLLAGVLPVLCVGGVLLLLDSRKNTKNLAQEKKGAISRL